VSSIADIAINRGPLLDVLPSLQYVPCGGIDDLFPLFVAAL